MNMVCPLIWVYMTPSIRGLKLSPKGLEHLLLDLKLATLYLVSILMLCPQSFLTF